MYPFETQDGQVERTCHVPRWIASHRPEADVVSFQVNLGFIYNLRILKQWNNVFFLFWSSSQRTHNYSSKS